MSRLPRRNVVLVITLVVVLFVSASTAMEEMLFQGWSQEAMVEMAGYGEEDLSTVLVTGSVLCEAYLHDGRQLQAWPVSGALVTVECRTEETGGGPLQTRGVTDEDGVSWLIFLRSYIPLPIYTENAESSSFKCRAVCHADLRMRLESTSA